MLGERRAEGVPSGLATTTLLLPQLDDARVWLGAALPWPHLSATATLATYARVMSAFSRPDARNHAYAHVVSGFST